MERDIKHGIGQAGASMLLPVQRAEAIGLPCSPLQILYASMQLSGNIQWLFF